MKVTDTYELGSLWVVQFNTKDNTVDSTYIFYQHIDIDCFKIFGFKLLATIYLILKEIFTLDYFLQYFPFGERTKKHNSIICINFFNAFDTQFPAIKIGSQKKVIFFKFMALE